VIEMRIADFAMPAMDELVNQIAKVRYMFGGQARARLVVRMPHGLLPGSAAQHSQFVESWFVNLPGVVVAAPSTASDLAGLLRAGHQVPMILCSCSSRRPSSAAARRRRLSPCRSGWRGSPGRDRTSRS
jgi:pyruvate/2-oxoglutarate/acetoin dehydrogenase E1 component